MGHLTIDRLKYVDALKAGGVPEAEARVHADALAAALAEGPDLATREDLERGLREQEARLDARIHESELRLEAKIAGIKADLLKWMIGAMSAQVLVLIALIKLLP